MLAAYSALPMSADLCQLTWLAVEWLCMVCKTGLLESLVVKHAACSSVPLPSQADVMSGCRKRRPSEDVYSYLHALGIHVEPSDEPNAKGDALSPESRAALAGLFSSMDDTSNR